MPSDVMITLVVCVALAVVALLAGVIAWRRSGRGTRLAAGLAWALIPIGAYLSGLADLVRRGVLETVAWAQTVPNTITALVGAIMIGAAVVALIIIGAVARRTPRAATSPTPTSAGGRGAKPAVTPAAKARRSSGDDEMDEIEALLKQRGIE